MESIDPLTRQMLQWLAQRPRTYREAMDAWRTSCPRLSIWDDAVLHGLIEVAGGGCMHDARVTVTPRGQALLAALGTS
jgi:hypothetical protein